MKNPATQAPIHLCLVALLALSGTACSPPTPNESAHEEPPKSAVVGQEGREDEHADETVQLTPEQAARMQIEIGTVKEAELGNELETTGQVEFDQNRLAHVSPRISGRVHRVAAALGDSVRGGQVLVEIDSIELGRTKAEFLQAKAQHQLAKETLEREETLFADRISSEQEVLEARAALRESQAELRTTEETLHLYGLSQEKVDALHYDDPQASIFVLRAPFSGKVVEKHATLGELVTPDDNLFLLADLSEVWILIDVYERDLAAVHLGDEVRVQIDAYPENMFDGEVSYLSDRVDPDTRTVRARINVANPDGRMRPGMFARIRISDPHGVAGEGKAPRTRVVPESAVQRDGDEMVVFVPTGQHRFERREVSLGRNAGGLLEILDGLVTGERVVTRGAFLLKAEAAKGDLGEGHGH